MFRPRKPHLVYLLALLWLAAVGFGFRAVYKYEFEPGTPAGDIPATSTGADGQLLLFVNPGCPCTGATLRELGRIMAQVDPASFDARVIMVTYPGEDPPEDTDNWKLASRIAGVQIVTDPEGHLAAKYDAKTSGHAIMHDSSGAARFSGGITGSRGHEGDNPGRAAVLAIARGHEPGLASTPVFGCEL